MPHSAPGIGAHSAAAALVVVLVCGGLWTAQPALSAIAIESNEQQAIADLIEFAGAEARFSMGFGGFGGPSVLSGPQASPNLGPPVGHPRFLWTVRNGYRFVFRGGRPDKAFAPMPDATSLPSFTYIAFPIVRGETGWRSFMFDSKDGVVRARRDGGEPRPIDPIVAQP